MPIKVIASASTTSGTTTSKIKPVKMLRGNRRSTLWVTSRDPCGASVTTTRPTSKSPAPSHGDSRTGREVVAPMAALLWTRDPLGRKDHVDAARAEDVEGFPRCRDGRADDAADPYILTGSQPPAGDFAADGN